MSDEVQLYFEQSGRSNLVSNLGRLIIHSVDRHPTVEGLGLDVELLQAELDHLKVTPPPHWVAFHAFAETQQRPSLISELRAFFSPSESSPAQRATPGRA